MTKRHITFHGRPSPTTLAEMRRAFHKAWFDEQPPDPPHPSRQPRTPVQRAIDAWLPRKP